MEQTGRKAGVSQQAQSVESHITDLYWHIINGTFQLVLTAEIPLLMPVLWDNGYGGAYGAVCVPGAAMAALCWTGQMGDTGQPLSPASCPRPALVELVGPHFCCMEGVQ